MTKCESGRERNKQRRIWRDVCLGTANLLPSDERSLFTNHCTALSATATTDGGVRSEE